MSAPLALLQLVSPALPVGAFSYSEGLEVLVQRGQLRSPQDVGDWLEAELRQGVVRLETAALEPMQQCLQHWHCLLYTSPSPRDATLSRMPSSA